MDPELSKITRQYNKKPNYAKKAIQYFLPIFIFSLIILSIVFFLIFKMQETKLINELILQKTKILKSYEIEIKDTLSNVISDVLIFSQDSRTKQTFKNPDNINNDTINDFINYCIYKKVFFQVRMINSEGMEILKIEKHNNKFIYVSKDKLQNKSKRYYFKESIQLKKNQLYISKFDLNIEHGKIEIPYLPTLRISAPVFSHTGQRLGFIIFNYDASLFFNKLTSIRYKK